MQARPLRVLVADDNRDTVMMLGILLRSEGMVVRLTTRGAEVQAAVGEFRPDAVLLDIGMPDRSGLQVALDLSREYGPKCPVLIAVTGYGRPDDRQGGLTLGHVHGMDHPPDQAGEVVAVQMAHENRRN